MSGLSFHGRSAVFWADKGLPAETHEFLDTNSFSKVTAKFLDHLRSHDSPYMELFPRSSSEKEQLTLVIELFKSLHYKGADEVSKEDPRFAHMLGDRYILHQFVEELYNFWRNYERYIVASSDEAPSYDQRPYRTFRETISHMNHLVRKSYRDICENITGEAPRVYRQVAAGFQVGVIAVKKQWECPKRYCNAADVPFVRQVLLNPPMMIDPPMNKRTGGFVKVDYNPLEGVDFEDGQWICYPAKVCDIVVNVMVHTSFMGLGCSLANLFELADDEDIRKKPAAIYAFGVPGDSIKGPEKTVFHDDEENNVLVAAVPSEPEFGYFGYLKKMILTLHNIAMMKRGRLPVHGAMVKITLKNGASANVVIVGDTGAGKSESLEAFRTLGEEHIRSLTIVFDDMGSLELTQEGELKAYGTEVGAFVRLDDLHPGFVFGNLDRSIIMSPQKVNARAVLPVTTIDEVQAGHHVDYVFYANNYEEVDEDHPHLERFKTADEAMEVFEDGAVMSKGTTTSTGIVHTYYANIFGPPEYRGLHDELAQRFFEKFFDKEVYVGQIRTRLGIPGYETEGPESAAKALFDEISK